MNSPIYEDYEDEEALLEAYAELFEATEILDQAYKKVTPNECANKQHHMLNEEQKKFQAILERHKFIFDDELGLYSHCCFLYSTIIQSYFPVVTLSHA